MDGWWGGGRFKTSIADSASMCMLHSAMDQAHEKVHSKDGVIARLHEISKFYELAVMQLDGCLKVVQEEADSSLESSDEEALGELAEIRDRLETRLRESELAISEKDRELTETLENELKLKQALELKDRELDSLRDILQLEKTKSDSIEEPIIGNQVTVVDEGDEKFSDLKDSVDQQVWNIKQNLDPEYSLTDERRNQGFGGIKIEQMSSDIDILKETMDIAFGKMQSAIFLPELELIEQQWRWTIEKDTTAVLIKGFMGDTQENFTAEVRTLEKQLSIGLSEHLSDLMKEITCLLEDQEHLSTSQGNLGGKISLKTRGKSSSEGDIPGIIDDPTIIIGKGDQTRQLSKEDPEDDSAHYVAKLIKSHESIIRRKKEELNRKKQEILNQKGSSYSRTEKDPVSPKQRIRDVTGKLQTLVRWSAKLGETFSLIGSKKNEGTSSTERLGKLDLIEQAKSCSNSTSEKVNGILVSHHANEELHNEIRMLKIDKADAKFQNMILEDIYITLLRGLGYESVIELNNHDLEIVKREGMHEHILKEMFNEWNEEFQDGKVEFQIREEINYVVFREALRGFDSTHSPLTEFRDTRAESNCLEDHSLEETISEEISRVIFAQIFKELNEAIEWSDAERKFKEENNSENFRDCFPQCNDFNKCIDYWVKGDVFMIFLKEMSKEWKAEIDCHNFECLIGEEIHWLVMVEAITKARSIYGRAEVHDHLRISEDLKTIDKLHIHLEIGEEENLMQTRVSPSKHIKVQDWKHSASSETKECYSPPDIVGMKHQKLDRLKSTREMLTDMDCNSASVCIKIKKALNQIAVSKGLLGELRSSLGIAVEDTDRFDDQITRTVPLVHNIDVSQLQLGKNLEVDANLSNSTFKPILEFLREFMEFKRIVEKKLVLNISRLEEAIHYLSPLTRLVALQSRQDLLYKKAFLRRCENLRRAETEVDLLGDQVDVLLGLLEKIYRTLYHYSPVLQQYFEVSEILNMIKKELMGAVRASGK